MLGVGQINWLGHNRICRQSPDHLGLQSVVCWALQVLKLVNKNQGCAKPVSHFEASAVPKSQMYTWPSPPLCCFLTSRTKLIGEMSRAQEREEMRGKKWEDLPFWQIGLAFYFGELFSKATVLWGMEGVEVNKWSCSSYGLSFSLEFWLWELGISWVRTLACFFP